MADFIYASIKTIFTKTIRLQIFSGETNLISNVHVLSNQLCTDAHNNVIFKGKNQFFFFKYKICLLLSPRVRFMFLAYDLDYIAEIGIKLVLVRRHQSTKL